MKITEPCDMGDLCIGCVPRNADGSCPDLQPAAGNDHDTGQPRMTTARAFVAMKDRGHATDLLPIRRKLVASY